MESDDAADALEIIHRFNPTQGLDESLDVRRLIHQLPRHLQYFASLLPEMSLGEICVATGKSRSWVYLMLRQLRIAFVQAGLRPPLSENLVRRHCRRRV